MKRGKDDEKITGPMFPRLHVNDTEKGGPRAPPRNKMALYEQLSIPRFNPNSSNLVSPASSSQGSGVERNVLFPRYLPTSTPHMAEMFHTRHSDGVNLSNPLAQLEKRKKAGDEDDFMVPVFVQSGIGQCQSKPQNRNDNEKFTSFSPSDASLSMKFQDAGDKDPKQTSFQGINLRQEARIQDNKNPKEHSSSGDHSAKSATNLSTEENINEPLKEANASPNQEYCDHPVANPRRLHDSDPCLQQEYRPRPLSEDTVSGSSFGEQMRDIEWGNVMRPRSNSPSGEVHSCPNEPDNDTGYTGDKTRGSVRTCNMDKNDDASETSMVDSILTFDISPDDVVGIIGPKHFWEARRAIVNQQRVFAVQIFELHRLIKVQRIIAGSPHLLLEDGAYLKHSLKDSPAKKRPAEYVVKPPPDIVKCKDESEKANHKMECSAENAVGKTFPSSVKNGSQPLNYEPYIRNPPPAPAATDTRMGPWSYQSPGHQWLLPVMSPSEGLVYKPYPGPGYTGTVCGGSGPFGPTPLAGNFMNPAYGIPPHHHQGIGVLPDAPPVGHSYFPPYAMLINPAVSGSSVEQTNQFAGTASRDQTVQVSGGGSNFNIQRQNSCNTSTQKGEAVPRDVKFPASKDSELQGSTASSPSDRGQGVRVGHTGEGRDALPLFPVAPVIPEAPAQLHENDQPRRVIKVVPHNPRSATESAARIFQSIQKQRKQYE